MSEHPDFQEFYLREIGVQTPLSLLSDHDPGQQAAQSPATARLESANPVSQAAAISSQPIPEIEPVHDSVRLDELARQAATCTNCPLSEQRNNVVFGTGNPQADIVFIGEAPGRDEDLQGEPFVGRAGQLLNRMLAAVGLDRSQVYIMNVVKCRPPNNRDPKPEEVEACSRWFDAQLAALSPKIICLLGRVAAQTVLETDSSLKGLRGKWHRFHGIPVRVIYHPAYLLRSPQQKRHAWHDLCAIRQESYASRS